MFIPAPNYTQCPNVLLDHWLPLLKEIELKILLFVIRQTFGWHRARDRISISQFEKATGSCPKNVLSAVNSLIGYGILKKEVIGKPGFQETYYEIIIIEDSNNSYPLSNCQPPPCQIASPPPGNLPVTKESSKDRAKETTNYPDAEASDLVLVSSFFEGIPELKNSNLTPSQKKTLHSKYSKEEIALALKSIVLENYASHFAIIVKAIENNYHPRGPSPEDIKEEKEKKSSDIKARNYEIAKKLEHEYADMIPFHNSFTVSEDLVTIKTAKGSACLSLTENQTIEILRSHIHKNT